MLLTWQEHATFALSGHCRQQPYQHGTLQLPSTTVIAYPSQPAIFGPWSSSIKNDVIANMSIAWFVTLKSTPRDWLWRAWPCAKVLLLRK